MSSFHILREATAIRRKTILKNSVVCGN